MSTSSSKPPKRSKSKPVAKAVSRPQQAEERWRKFDEAAYLSISLMGLLIIARILVTYDLDTPVARVGDMLDFTTNQNSVMASNVSVSDVFVPARLISGVWASPGRACTLDLPKLVNPGGTMTVMAVRPDGVIVSWAGGVTAPGTSDCMGKEQILVANKDYKQLFATVSTSPFNDPR